MRRVPIAREDRGFTLVELLVVMIIIGVLAAIAIPVFLSQRTKAVDTSIRSDLRTVSTEVATYLVDGQGLVDSGVAYGYLPIKQAAAMAVPPVTVTTTTGNEIQFKALGGGAYCLRGWSEKASTTGRGAAGTYFFFDSQAGGNVPGAATATSTNC